jgi:DNA (cytosine-5)-methyltransferase 1
MKALDLFCCDGGAATGLSRAGFTKIVGIDKDPHPNYPFEFIQADATDPPVVVDDFDFIWASPPCQGYSVGTLGWRNQGKEYPDLVSATRAFLNTTNKPWVIENVPQAPIKKHLLLCGQMFKLPIIRHRIFEISGFRAEQPRHPHHFDSVNKGSLICVATGTDGVGGFGFRNKEERAEARKRKKSKYIQVAGHGGDGWSSTIKSWQWAMGIHHITDKKFLAEAVPPAYSEYIAKEFFRTREFCCNPVVVSA